MSTRRKKYAKGTGPMGYIPSPNEAIAENDLVLAKDPNNDKAKNGLENLSKSQIKKTEKQEEAKKVEKNEKVKQENKKEEPKVELKPKETEVAKPVKEQLPLTDSQKLDKVLLLMADMMKEIKDR